ncbi:MAG: MMPL family transporter [Planctomycetota bacterium]
MSLWAGREWPRVVAGALVLAALSVFVATQMKVTTDISHFLPGGAADARLSLARQVAVGEISRTTIVLIDAAGPEQAAAVSVEYEAALRADPASAGLLALEGAPAAGFEEALWNVYRARRLSFAAASAGEVPALLRDDGIAAAVDRLKRKLSSPMASVIGRVAPEDPLLILPGLFERLTARGDELQLVDGRYVTADGKGAVLFVTTRASASDSQAQGPVLAAIRAAFDAVNARHGGELRLQLCGTNRHAIASQQSSEADIARVSIGSTVGLLLTFLLLFSSLRLPLSWLPVLSAGFLVGASACILVFGQIHGMTLAFGSSLIGVSIDYAVHFYCHQALAPEPAGPRATLRRLWPALLLGCGTTVLGFVVLLVATFPGLREMAWFASTGLVASLAAAWLFLPGLVGPIGSTAASRLVVRAMTAVTSLRGKRRRWYLVPIAAVVLVATLGVPQARWNDGLSSLNRPDAALTAEDARVVERVARVEQRRLVAAVANDEQATLAVNERVAGALAAAVTAGELGSYRSIAGALPSAATQRAVAAAMRADATLWPRLSGALQAAGFVTERFTPFREALAAPEPAPVTFDDLLSTPLASLVRPFRLKLDDGRVAIFSYLHGIRDEQALAARVAAVSGAQLFDVEAVLSDAFAAYRERMLTLLVVGVLAVLGVVALRYRRLRLIALAVVPALLGALGTVGVLALLDCDISLLSLVSLLMVVSMGVDYGIFLAEDDLHPHARGATQLGVFVDGWTTILGFGLLATSPQPALFAIGASAGIGVTLCLILALTFGALFASKGASP